MSADIQLLCSNLAPAGSEKAEVPLPSLLSRQVQGRSKVQHHVNVLWQNPAV